MNRVAVFARAPVAGEVKRRLSPALPAELAAKLYAALLADTLAAARACRAGDRTVWWAEEPAPADLAPGFGERIQHGADLGERMAGAFAQLSASPGDRTVLIGSDCPGIESIHLDHALQALGENDVVLGPASDGGYWLIGLSVPAPGLFEDMPWSSPEVAARTLARAEEAGLRVAAQPRLDDLDTPADLARLVGACARGDACGEHTRAELRALGFLP